MPSGSEARKIFAGNLSYYLKLNNTTAVELSRALGVSESTISYWLSGKSYPRVDKIEAIADYFGISMTDLVEDHNAEPDDGMTPATKILFQSLRGATEEDILQAAKIIEALRK